MSFADKLLCCIDCQKTFTFSAIEQEFHSSRGFPNEPQRCPSCRKAKKTEHTSNNVDADEASISRRQSFQVTCTLCGKDTRVPFQPRQNMPVYCSNCYIKTRVGK
jgi:CxxC-x17-CxxC domain-containing protein